MVKAEQLWESCLAGVRGHVPEASWSSCFQPTRAVAIDGSTLIVAVPSSLVRDRLESRWIPQIRSALSAAGAPELYVDFQIRPCAGQVEGTAGTEAVVDDTTEELPLLVLPEPAPPPRATAGSASLNSRYTFEAFVPAESNRFAHAAALSVAERPARSYNPLFIYGVAGLGKTHLLHAIAHYVHQNLPSHTVRYVSCEAFMNDFVDAIRTNTGLAFKRRYRENDILLIDDIQFMEGKEGLQEEFFHTFNSLHGTNRQIVISSDRPPRAIATLEDRLRSRFEWGLITEIRPPDLETRLAILRKKSEREPVDFPDEVLAFIATHIKNNIRELEGAIIRLSAWASLTNVALSTEVVSTVLGDVLGSRPRVITTKRIIEATAAMYGFDVEELLSRSRRRPLVNARQVAMYVCRDTTDLSYPAIARAFGGRDHTTVIHAVEKIGALMKERRQIYDQVTELTQTIRGAP